MPSSKVHALDVFLALACHLTDEAKLDRMIPYIVELLHDDSALVRAAALRTLMQVVSFISLICLEAGLTSTLAHACDSRYTFKRRDIPRIHHPQHQTSCR